MAETEVLEPVLETLKETIVDVLNETLDKSNETTFGKTPSTPEGIAIAYGSLVFMALLPIFLGSFRSVKKELKEIANPMPDHNGSVPSTGEDVGIMDGLLVGSRPPGEPVESMSSKDAMMFPLIASAALLGLYVFFKVFSASSVNFLLTAYFFVLGVFALTHLLTPVVSKITPDSLKKPTYQLLFFKKDKEAEMIETPQDHRHRHRMVPEEIFNLAFDKKDAFTFFICILVGCWYFIQKHWIANNLFGLAFAINGVEFLQLPRVSTGFILLGGLFFYDIFWVFGTDVMITVAKSFEAPIKLVFPQDLLQNGPLSANNFAMLGLGDIVIPGIFIALLLRFDLSRNNQKGAAKPYFYTGFIAYLLGLLLTIFVMHVYKHAQPALLYLVPSCLGAPMLLALAKGEVMALMNYEDEQVLPEEEHDSEEYEDDLEEEEEEVVEDLGKKR